MYMYTSTRPLVLAVALSLTGSLVLAGCQGEESPADRRPIGEMSSEGGQGSQAEARRDVSPTVAAQIDSGNAAYRAEDYEAARTHYRRALEERPGYEAAWFGVYMAENALGNDAAADSALQQAGSLADTEAMHPAPGDSAGGGAGPAHPPIPEGSTSGGGGG